jgi:hypothetical protein
MGENGGTILSYILQFIDMDLCGIQLNGKVLEGTVPHLSNKRAKGNHAKLKVQN